MNMNNNQMPSTMPSPNSNMDFKNNQEKEIREALDVTNDALEHVNKAIHYIDGATDWGLFDVICGGAGISSIVKHDNINKVSKEMSKANEAIKKLNIELEDVKDFSFNIKDSTIFFDVFLDNIFSDLKVQSKIADAESKCKKARRELESIKKELNNRLKQCQNPDQFEKDRSEVVKTEKDQEKELNEAFEASNNAYDLLQNALRGIKNASEFVGGGVMFFGGAIGYISSEKYLRKARNKMRDANTALDDLSKKVTGIKGIDSTMTTEFSRFKEIYEDISDCKNVMFDNKNGKEKFAEARQSCLGSISQVDAIRNILKERLVQYQKEN